MAANPVLPRRWAGWGFVGPFFVVFVLALVVPIGYAIYLSLFRQQLIGGNAFVGLSNYRLALSDPQFWSSLRRVLLFLAVQVPVMLVLALLAALALDSARLRWAPLYRLGLFLPYAVPAVVAALMWGFMYGPQFGLIGSLRSASAALGARPAVGQLGACGHRQRRHLGVRRATTC